MNNDHAKNLDDQRVSLTSATTDHPFNHALGKGLIQPVYRELDEFDVDQLVELMKQPVRAVGECITKSQLQTLCVQLLAQNLTLQKKLLSLKV